MTKYKITAQRKRTETFYDEAASVEKAIERFKVDMPEATIIDVQPVRTFEVKFELANSYSVKVEAKDEEDAKRQAIVNAPFYKLADYTIADVKEITEEN